MRRDLFSDPFFAERPGPVSFRVMTASPDRAVESAWASTANGLAAEADRYAPDPDWQPL